MLLTRWDPLREMARFDEDLYAPFRRLFEGSAPRWPLVNVWAGEDDAVLTAELPGMEVGDIEISVLGDTLTLHGTRKSDELKEGGDYHRRERGLGEFTRTLQLPFRVEASKVNATMSRGVLRVALPRAAEDKPRKIAIKAA
jgi:HSP20 family protein